jgi:pimeloyl-ACP methyl ester carboxylesterase
VKQPLACRKKLEAMDKENQKIILKDGRVLGFAEYGVATGNPVLHFHGSGSSRLERPASENILIQLNVRFISVDRPGHGLSGSQPERRLLDWPQDITQLADHLGLEKFYVTGHSAGGPHVLVCAHELAERIIAGVAISSVAPMSRPRPYDGMPILNQILARSARRWPWLTHLIRKTMRNLVMQDMEKAAQQLMASIPDSDKEILYEPKNVENMVLSIQEGFRQGYEGVAHDDILVNTDWGFELKSIEPRIDIWHGKLDMNVPIHAAHYLCDQIPHNRCYELTDKGHFFVLDHWEEVFSKLLNVR